MLLYNTLTRQKEEFKPLKNKKAGFYACGPTVYYFAHLGNFRTYIFEDILKRTLEYNGYKVKHIMNFTDVGHLTSDADTGEEKMEVGARREGKTAQEIADFYIKAFKEDTEKLNIEPPTVYARATDFIKEQIELVKILEKKGFTYKINDGIYFDSSKLKDYGKLARLDIEGLKKGARVAEVAGKKNPTDFAVWKLSPPGIKRQQEWNSPWGKGFPGWHLECSAMSKKFLGEQFDIHCGGIDLIPVHHTNEIAQSEAAYGKIPARYWIHSEFLMIDGNKMSKSLNNLITLEKTSKAFMPLAFRYLTLGAHYRSLLNLSWESLEASQNALNKLYQLVWSLKSEPQQKECLKKMLAKIGLAGKEFKKSLKQINNYEKEFLDAVNNDLDTPKALSIIWKLTGDNSIPNPEKLNLLLQFDKILGLDFDRIKVSAPSKKIKKLAADRENLRQQKKWTEADNARKQIEKEGWELEDTTNGIKLKPKIISIK